MSLAMKKQPVRTSPRGLRRNFIVFTSLGASLCLLALFFVFNHPLTEKRPVQKYAVNSSPIEYQHQSAEKPAEGRREHPLKQGKAQPIQRAAKPGADIAAKKVRRLIASDDKDQSGLGTASQEETAIAYSQELVAGLSNVTLETWTPEMLPRINHILQALVAQGKAALPSIRQLLQSGKDFRFSEEMDAADLSDYASIRLGLFDVLRQIGGPEAEDILLGELQITYDAQEISTLTKSLEALAPGQYRDVAVAAAQETLDLAAETQLAAENGETLDAAEEVRLAANDASLLFQILQTKGDASVVPELEYQTELYGLYATVALAGLQDNNGIPTLVNMVNQRPAPSADNKPVQSTDIYVDNSLFALQMLAQTALKDPDAHATLVEQTSSNRIPDSLWPKIGLALAGQYQYQNEKPEKNELLQMVSDPAAEERTYPHVIGKNGQVIYIKNRYGLEKLPPGEIDARLKLIDELLAVSPGRAADQALNHSRSLLMANKAKK